MGCNLNGDRASGGCNGRDPDAGVAGTCGPKGGAGTTCYLTDGCSAAGGSVPMLALLLLARWRSRRARR